MNKLIKEIDYDSNYFYGCETCDYGSSYIEIFNVKFYDNDLWQIEIYQMYEYVGISEADLMKIAGISETKQEFKDKLIDCVKANGKSWSDARMYINSEIVYES